MNKNTLPALILTLVLLFSACGGGSENSGTQITIYRSIDSNYRTDGELVRAEKIPFTPGVGLINSAISAFNSAPSSPELQNPLPSGARIVGYRLQSGVLRLETEGCDELAGPALTLFCCCAVLTFCTIDSVNTVSIYSGDEALCPALSADDIILADTSA